MHRFVSFNGEILPAPEASLAAVSSAALYGKGIFTTVAIYNSEPFLWEKHWRRLIENAEKIGIDLAKFSSETTKNSLLEIIKENAVKTGRARITFFDELASGIWQIETKRKIVCLITTANFREFETEFRLTVSPFRINSTSPLTNVKSCNYLENLLALQNARSFDFDEAVRLNERGEIASACMANVFWMKDGKLFTPSLKTGCLAGTTREFVLENQECLEVEESLEALREADALFLTSTGIGIVQVAEFEGRRLATNYTNNTNDFSSLIRAIRVIRG